MAAQQKSQVDGVSPAHLESAFEFAHAYLMGATVALVNAGMLTSMAAMNLLRDLMQPIEQPLVDTGAVERVSTSLEGRFLGGIKRTEPDR